MSTVTRKPKKVQSKDKSSTQRCSEAVLPKTAEALMSRASVAALLGISIAGIKKMVDRGEYPEPDYHLGKFPRWSTITHNKWIESKTRQ